MPKMKKQVFSQLYSMDTALLPFSSALFSSLRVEVDSRVDSV